MFLRYINRLVGSDNIPINRIFHRHANSVNLLEKWKNKFEEEKVPEVHSSLKIILAHVLNVKKVWKSLLQEMPLNFVDLLNENCRFQLPELPQNSKDFSMTKLEQERFEQLCECRMARMPVQYIIGEWDFRELTLKMQPPVFIPRPETEELVELILQQFDVKEPVKFLEVGCGSGCISLSLLYSLSRVRESRKLRKEIRRRQIKIFFVSLILSPRPRGWRSIRVKWHAN